MSLCSAVRKGFPASTEDFSAVTSWLEIHKLCCLCVSAQAVSCFSGADPLIPSARSHSLPSACLGLTGTGVVIFCFIWGSCFAVSDKITTLQCRISPLNLVQGPGVQVHYRSLNWGKSCNRGFMPNQSCCWDWIQCNKYLPCAGEVKASLPFFILEVNAEFHRHMLSMHIWHAVLNSLLWIHACRSVSMRQQRERWCVYIYIYIHLHEIHSAAPCCMQHGGSAVISSQSQALCYLLHKHIAIIVSVMIYLQRRWTRPAKDLGEFNFGAGDLRHRGIKLIAWGHIRNCLEGAHPSTGLQPCGECPGGQWACFTHPQSLLHAVCVETACHTQYFRCPVCSTGLWVF